MSTEHSCKFLQSLCVVWKYHARRDVACNEGVNGQEVKMMLAEWTTLVGLMPDTRRKYRCGCTFELPHKPPQQ